MHENPFVLNLLTVYCLLCCWHGAGHWEIGQWTNTDFLPPTTLQSNFRRRQEVSTCGIPTVCQQSCQNYLPPFTPASTMPFSVFYISVKWDSERSQFNLTKITWLKSDDSEFIPWSNSKICAMTTFFPGAKQAQSPTQTLLYWVLFSWPAHLHKKQMNAVLFGPKKIKVFFQTICEEVAFI